MRHKTLTFEPTITLGTIIQLITMVVLVVAFATSLKGKLDSIKEILEMHNNALQKHDAMLAVYETRIFTMVADIQKLIGKFEMVINARS